MMSGDWRDTCKHSEALPSQMFSEGQTKPSVAPSYQHRLVLRETSLTELYSTEPSSPQHPAVVPTSVLPGLWLKEPSERSRIRSCRGESWQCRRTGERRGRGAISAREREPLLFRDSNNYTPSLVAVQIKPQVEIHVDKEI